MDWKAGVTFGGSGLDRAAELRGDEGAMAALLAEAGARVLVFWEGKPALFPAAAMAWVLPGAEILSDAGPLMFLGRDDDGPWFAADVDRWQPDVMPHTLDAFLDASEQVHPGLPEGARFVELRNVLAELEPRQAELLATAKAVLGWHRSHRFCSKCGGHSEMADAGWQRLCPACGARHFPRTDPVVIMLVVDGDKALLGRSPHWPEKMYSLLAGFVEPGETLEAAVRREVLEETGVQVSQVDYALSQPWPFPNSLMFGCVGLAETTDITIDPQEIEDALWVTRAEMGQILDGTHADIGQPRQGAVARYLMEAWVARRAEVSL